MKNNVVKSAVAATPEQPQKLVNTLTTVSPLFDAGQGGSYQRQLPGFLYQAVSYNNQYLPLSYWATIDYFSSSYVRGTIKSFDVQDDFNAGNSTLSPHFDSCPKLEMGKPRLCAADLQMERVNITNGIDIYDAATYQIALALAEKNNLKSATSDFTSLITAQNALLTNGYDGNAANNKGSATQNANRAVNSPFTYNGQTLPPSNAYYFRMVPQNWCSVDPFQFNTTLKAYITQNGIPTDKPNFNKKCYALGNITWQDWKPITGENVWAFLIGPMQNILISGQTPSANDPAIQNAINLLPALQAMQSTVTGAIYYAVTGSLGNQENVPPGEISTENNASCLAGLLLLRKVLIKIGGQEQNIQTIDAIVLGGGTVRDPKANPKGILDYFKDYAWNGTMGIFYQGGSDASGQFVANTTPNAVDVNTWTMTVLGPKLMDDWFGKDAAYKCWGNVKSWGGFYDKDGQTLLGVGYSDQDHNGPSTPLVGINSAEWTFGAITAVKALLAYYGAGRGLAKDEASMLEGVKSLRSDNYPTSPYYAKTRPDKYSDLIPNSKDNLFYVYASKRYFIPFGWYANPIPSLCSTSWAIMVHYGYNPFKFDGSYDKSPVLDAYPV